MPDRCGAVDVLEGPVADEDRARRVARRRPRPARPRNASGCGLRPRDLAGVDGAVDQVEHAVAGEDPLVVLARPDRVGQHADPHPALAQASQQRRHLGVGPGVRLPELLVRRQRGRVPLGSPGRRRPRASISSSGALPPARRAGRPGGAPRPRAAARPAPACTRVGRVVARSRTRASWSRTSTVCQGVSVPPQSKMTASIRRAERCRSRTGRSRPGAAAASPTGDLLALAAAPVARPRPRRRPAPCPRPRSSARRAARRP